MALKFGWPGGVINLAGFAVDAAVRVHLQEKGTGK